LNWPALTWSSAAARKLAGYFVADARLAAFVPAWIAAIWLCMRLLPHLPSAIPALLLACGPIAALWWSVREAAQSVQSAREIPSLEGDRQ
jgi:hypothetical protein